MQLYITTIDGQTITEISAVLFNSKYLVRMYKEDILYDTVEHMEIVQWLILVGILSTNSLKG